MPSSRESSQPRDWAQVTRTAGEFFTIWATGKPKNTRVGSLSHSFCRGSSWPRNQNRVSYIAGGFFTSWATREALKNMERFTNLHVIYVWSEVKWKSFSCVQLFATPWTIQFMEFSRSVYWSGLAFPFFRGSSQPRDWTQVSCSAGRFFTSWATGEAYIYIHTHIYIHIYIYMCVYIYIYI